MGVLCCGNQVILLKIILYGNMAETSSSHTHSSACRCDYSYLRKKGPKFEGETTTQAYYKPYAVERAPTYEVPKPKPKHYDPDVLQTSYKMQYVKPKIPSQDTGLGASNSLMESYHARKAKVPFYSETEYKKNFEPKQVKVQKQPVYQYKPRQAKFEGESSYKQEYTAKKNDDLLSAGHEIISAQNLYNQKPKVKFEGETSYKSTYQKYDVKQQRQPQFKYQPKNAKFEGESSYKATYTKLPESAYKSDIEHCPVHPERVAIK